MKIKRFEAPSMSEALRMIKKEFGEEAVILSAKNMKKPGRFLGTRSGGQVVVTAAVDRSITRQSVENDAHPLQSPSDSLYSHRYEKTGDEKPAEGIERILQHFTPITRTGRNKMQPKIVQLINDFQSPSASSGSLSMDRSIFEALKDQGIVNSIAADLAEKTAELLPDHSPPEEETVSVLSQIIDAKGWVAPKRAPQSATPAIVVLVGPCGAGKTAVAAKMAAQAVLNDRQTVGLISLDNHRIAGTTELQRYANVMQVPFAMVEDEEQFNRTLHHMRSMQLIVVDTPGLSPNNVAYREKLQRLLRITVDPEVHLLINAVTREDVIADMIAFFKPVGVTRLLPTHMDWVKRWGALMNQAALNRMSIGFWANGPRVPEHFRALSSRELAGFLLSRNNVADDASESSINLVQSADRSIQKAQYVANSNSDIFHLNTCKSVSRINDDNVLIFKDSDEAIEQGFKPCRMCCMSLFVPKPIDRPARRRYAGSRN